MRNTHTFIIALLASAWALSAPGDLAGQPQSDTAYVIVHAHNPEGVEIASIDPRPQYHPFPGFRVDVCDGDYYLGPGANSTETHNRPIPISPGTHTIRVHFNGMTQERTVTLEPCQTKVVEVTFDRTEFDLRGWIDSRNLKMGISHTWEGTATADDGSFRCYDRQTSSLGAGPGFFEAGHCVSASLLTDDPVVVSWRNRAEGSVSFTGTAYGASFEVEADMQVMASPGLVQCMCDMVSVDLVHDRVDLSTEGLPPAQAFEWWYVQQILDGYVPQLYLTYPGGLTLEHIVGANRWGSEDWRCVNEYHSSCFPADGLMKDPCVFLMPFGGPHYGSPVFRAYSGHLWQETSWSGRYSARYDGTIKYLRTSSVPYDVLGTGVKDGQNELVVRVWTGGEQADGHFIPEWEGWWDGVAGTLTIHVEVLRGDEAVEGAQIFFRGVSQGQTDGSGHLRFLFPVDAIPPVAVGPFVEGVEALVDGVPVKSQPRLVYECEALLQETLTVTQEAARAYGLVVGMELAEQPDIPLPYPFNIVVTFIRYFLYYFGRGYVPGAGDLITAEGYRFTAPNVAPAWVVRETVTRGGSVIVWRCSWTESEAKYWEATMPLRHPGLLDGVPYAFLEASTGVLGPSGRSSREIAIGADVSDAVFVARWSGSHLDVILHTPTGATVDPETGWDEPAIVYRDGETYAYYWLGDPLPGTWTVELVGADVAEEGEQYVVYAIALRAMPFSVSRTCGAPQNPLIEWIAVPGRAYAVWASPDLSDWVLAEETLPASDTGLNSWTDGGQHPLGPASEAARRFYRVEQLP